MFKESRAGVVSEKPGLATLTTLYSRVHRQVLLQSHFSVSSVLTQPVFASVLHFSTMLPSIAIYNGNTEPNTECNRAQCAVVYVSIGLRQTVHFY